MMIRGYEIAGKLIAYVVAGIVIIALALLVLNQCSKRRSEAAQSRVEHSQGEAAQNSAIDAINAVTGVGSNQAASEELGRANEKDIRAAQGAKERVGTGVDVAGRAALCKRKAYANDPKCAPFRRSN